MTTPPKAPGTPKAITDLRYTRSVYLGVDLCEDEQPDPTWTVRRRDVLTLSEHTRWIADATRAMGEPPLRIELVQRFPDEAFELVMIWGDHVGTDGPR